MFERCLYFNVNALARQVNRIWEQAFKEYDLSPAHAYCLRLVLAEPGMLQKDIAEELKLEKSTVTRFIDALQDKGLVKRIKHSQTDGREHQIIPTAKAKKIHDALEASGEQLYRNMLDNIGDKKLKSLVSDLRVAAKKLG